MKIEFILKSINYNIFYWKNKILLKISIYNRWYKVILFIIDKTFFKLKQ